MPIDAYAAKAAKQSLERFAYQPDNLGPWDIEVAITHCGICHSDIHLIDNDWQGSIYPLVPGHEIVGTVTQLGAQVTHLQKGDRVGIGWQRSSCMSCEWCQKGEENMCLQNEATCNGHFGGFAKAIRADGRFAFKIPDNLTSENAAPLLCGGVTVYSPLRLYDVNPSMKVGVIGIGGLGHLAVQFARAFGCEVTAFSSSPDKEAEAKSFGAHHFVVGSDKGALEKSVRCLDFIISTVYADLDWGAYIKMLRPHGKLCFVGAALGPVSTSLFPLLFGQLSICGSVIGGRPAIAEMLDFAARHNIFAKTEAVPMDQVNSVIAKVRQGKARYRMVLVNK
ncbi:MAG: NAD(P)-dependent alcohol dehydrogenase [Candidatus Zixiibacteriota bacterium]|nr:MAG: NAD(P)-dependent alcohol dehydrogenase [candidate division Zixibacteria bacterium]